MSYGDQPTFTLGRSLGCAAYAIIGLFVSIYFMAAAALGDCASDGACLSEAARAFMFYGVPILVLIGGIFLARYFLSEED